MYEYLTIEECKKQLEEKSKSSWISSDFQLCYMTQVDEPEELEKGEYIAYFTNIPLNKQWGDDWDDAPYEYNAECPYDAHYEEEERIGHTIKCIYFTPKTLYCKLPKDWAEWGNSPFCVKDINAGAVAWLFNGRKAIYAGCGLLTFLKEIEDF